jgi:hypothetical protein
MGKYDKADSLIKLYESYTDVALALALEGKISPADDEHAHALFAAGKFDKLSKLYHQRKRQLHKPVSFLEPKEALKDFTPEAFEKDDPHAIPVFVQETAVLKRTKGTRLYARTLLNG